MISKFIKIAGFSLLAILITSAFWYFLKPYDYTIHFKAKALPGTISQTLKTWSIGQKNAEIIASDATHFVKQKITSESDTLIFNWKFLPINDTLTNVNVEVLDAKSTFTKRLSNLFSNTTIKESSKNTVKSFIAILKAHLETHRVKIDGEVNSPSTFCAYVSLKAKQVEKAKGMMFNYGLLSNFVVMNNITLNGRPRIEITNWNTQNDSLYYNFCFPIKEQATLPFHPKIKFKKLTSKRSIKATYNGNYITSDRAWYALLNYAKNNNVELEKTPIEVFLNNPNFGGDDTQWKAEIYMPLKE